MQLGCGPRRAKPGWSEGRPGSHPRMMGSSLWPPGTPRLQGAVGQGTRPHPQGREVLLHPTCRVEPAPGTAVPRAGGRPCPAREPEDRPVPQGQPRLRGRRSPPAPGCSRCSVAAFLACCLPRTPFNGRKALRRVRGVGNVYCLASETLESTTGKAQSQSCPGCSAEPELQPKGSEQRGRGKATACKHAARKTLPFAA